MKESIDSIFFFLKMEDIISVAVVQAIIEEEKFFFERYTAVNILHVWSTIIQVYSFVFVKKKCQHF